MASGDSFNERRLRFQAYNRLRNVFGGARDKYGNPTFNPGRTRNQAFKDMPIEKIKHILEASDKELERMARNGEIWYH